MSILLTALLTAALAVVNPVPAAALVEQVLFANPVTIVDRDSGRIVLLSALDSGYLRVDQGLARGSAGRGIVVGMSGQP